MRLNAGVKIWLLAALWLLTDLLFVGLSLAALLLDLKPGYRPALIGMAFAIVAGATFVSEALLPADQSSA